MRSRVMMIVKIARQHAAQVALAENDSVIQTFAADRADETLGVGILPGRSRRSDDLGDAHLHELLAFDEPDALVQRLMVEIDRMANTPFPLAEREQWIAEAEAEIDRLQRCEEAIVVATGAPREHGCLPWVVLGVKALDAPVVRAA